MNQYTTIEVSGIITKIELRDYIATSVLPEILKASGQIEHQYAGASNILASDCEFAYKVADAMIRARSVKFD